MKTFISEWRRFKCKRGGGIAAVVVVVTVASLICWWYVGVIAECMISGQVQRNGAKYIVGQKNIAQYRAGMNGQEAGKIGIGRNKCRNALLYSALARLIVRGWRK